MRFLKDQIVGWFRSAALALVALAGPVAAQEGVWASSLGEMRLHAFADLVVGEVGADGVLIATATDGCLRGHVISVRNARSFAARIDAGRMVGQSMTATQQTFPFAATRTGPGSGEFANFAADGRILRSLPNLRTVYDGRYDTSFGPLNLTARDLFVVGDFGQEGVIVGLWDGNSYQGRFVDDLGRTGQFDLAFLSRTGGFRDGLHKLSGQPATAWTLRRVDTATPTIRNPGGDLDCAGQATPDYAAPNDLDLAFRDIGVIVHHTRTPFKTSPARFTGHVTSDPNWTGAAIDAADTGMATSLGTLVGRDLAPPDVVMAVVTPQGAPGSTCVVSYRGTDRESKYREALKGRIDEGLIATNLASARFAGTGSTCTVKEGYLDNYEESRARVIAFLNDATARGECGRGVLITGMSLGGATANLAFADLMVVRRSTVSEPVRALAAARKIWLVTAGAPRSISEQCAAGIHRLAGQNVTRFIYGSLSDERSRGVGPDSCARFIDPVPGNPTAVRTDGLQGVQLGHFGSAVVGHNTFTGRNPSTPAMSGVFAWRCDGLTRCESKRFANAYARVATRTATMAFPPGRFPEVGRDPGASCSGPGLIPAREYMFGRLHDTCSYRNLMAVYGQRRNGEPDQPNHPCRFPPDADDPSNHPHPTCPLGRDAFGVGAEICPVAPLRVQQFHQR